MKYKLIFLLGLLMFSGIVNAGMEDVMFKLRLEYIPNSQTTCTPQSDNSTNQTWNNCSTLEHGQIRLIGGEDETHIGITENLQDIISGRVYTGYKTADLGNLSDITGINDKLQEFIACNNNLNSCMDSNRNISSHLTLLQEDSGLKLNFTECSTNLIKANSDLDIKKSDIKAKSDLIKSLESSKFMWILLGGIIGAVIIGIVVPKMKGTDTPKDSTGNDHPPNPGYT